MRLKTLYYNHLKLVGLLFLFVNVLSDSFFRRHDSTDSGDQQQKRFVVIVYGNEQEVTFVRFQRTTNRFLFRRSASSYFYHVVVCEERY